MNINKDDIIIISCNNYRIKFLCFPPSVSLNLRHSSSCHRCCSFQEEWYSNRSISLSAISFWAISKLNYLQIFCLYCYWYHMKSGSTQIQNVNSNELYTNGIDIMIIMSKTLHRKFISLPTSLMWHKYVNTIEKRWKRENPIQFYDSHSTICIGGSKKGAFLALAAISFNCG